MHISPYAFSAEPPLRVLVVDDHPESLAALIDLLADEPSVSLVGAALRVDDAIALALVRRPDVVLVDVRMPDGGGERVASTIRLAIPHVRIVALSAYLDEAQIRGMLSAGADQYQPKEADVATLIRGLVHDSRRGLAN